MTHHDCAVCGEFATERAEVGSELNGFSLWPLCGACMRALERLLFAGKVRG